MIESRFARALLAITLVVAVAAVSASPPRDGQSDVALIVPVDEDLLKLRDSQTAFGTGSSHISIESHSWFLFHQANVFWPSIARSLEEAGTQDGIHIVDFGGGPGHLAALLANRYPRSKVTVVDIDHAFLSTGARQYAELVKAGRLEFLHASVLATRLPDASVDLLVAQFLFQHLYQPREALLEAHRVLREGGRLMVVDVDENQSDIIYPAPPTMALVGKMNDLHAATHALGLDGGRLVPWLPLLMQTLGMRGVSAKPVLVTSHAQGAEHFLPLLAPEQYFALVRYGLITEQVRQRAGSDRGAGAAMFLLSAVALSPKRKTDTAVLKSPRPALLASLARLTARWCSSTVPTRRRRATRSSWAAWASSGPASKPCPRRRPSRLSRRPRPRARCPPPSETSRRTSSAAWTRWCVA